jgi:addiction module HigA family antidote
MSSMTRKLAPIHPGEILREDLADAGISATRLAREIHTAPERVALILRGERPLSADMALRLAQFFGTSPTYWMNLQAQYELAVADKKAGDRIRNFVRTFQPSA